jgi:hypothetical protein
VLAHLARLRAVGGLDLPADLGRDVHQNRLLRLAREAPGGTRLTRNLCALLKRPYALVDARETPEAEAVAAVAEFVEKHAIQTLNVAGPRASGWPEGYSFAVAVSNCARIELRRTWKSR